MEPNRSSAAFASQSFCRLCFLRVHVSRGRTKRTVGCQPEKLRASFWICKLCSKVRENPRCDAHWKAMGGGQFLGNRRKNPFLPLPLSVSGGGGGEQWREYGDKQCQPEIPCFRILCVIIVHTLRLMYGNFDLRALMKMSPRWQELCAPTV